MIEGYPRTISQLDDFEGVVRNQEFRHEDGSQVARVDVAILIDCTEQFCEEMVKKRFEESGHRKGRKRQKRQEISSFRRLSRSFQSASGHLQTGHSADAETSGREGKAACCRRRR